MDAFLKKHKITVFDLEGYKETGRIWEYSFLRTWIDKSPIVVSVDRIMNIPDDLLKPLIDVLDSSDLIVGHNIEFHDLIILSKRGCSISQKKIWDTLKIELLLATNIERHSFALKTKHRANNDVLVTTDLFCSQIHRVLEYHDEYNSFKDILPENAQTILNSAMKDDVEVCSSEKEVFFYDEVFPISNYYSEKLSNLFSENKLDNYLKDNKKLLIIAPDDLWDAVVKAFPVEIRKKVLFCTKKTNNEYKLNLLSDYSFFGLNPWSERVIKRYYDNTQFVFLFQLPDYLQHYIQKYIPRDIHVDYPLDCKLLEATIICIDPTEINLIDSLPQMNKAIVVGGESLIVRDFDYDSSKTKIHNCIYAKICFKKPSFYNKTRVLPDPKSNTGVNWDDLSQKNLGYTPIIVIKNFKKDPIIKDYITDIEDSYKKSKPYHNLRDSSVRRIELAWNNNGFAFLEMQEFLFLNKVIEGDYVIIFDNLVSTDIDNIERNISIVLHLAAQFFNHPRIIINDRYYNHYWCSDPIIQFNC